MKKLIFITFFGMLFGQAAWAGTSARVVTEADGVLYIEGRNWTMNQVLFGTCTYAKATHEAKQLGYSYGYAPNECMEDVSQRFYSENVISGPLGKAVSTNCYTTVACKHD